MAKTIKINVHEKEASMNKKIRNNNTESFIKKNTPDVLEEICKSQNTAHMLITVHLDGHCAPEVGEKVTCKKQFMKAWGCTAIVAINAEGYDCGYIFHNKNDDLHGLRDDIFEALPENFVGTVVEHGSALQRNSHLMTIAVEFEAKVSDPAFTVVTPGQTLLASYGSVFTAKKEPRLNGCGSVFAVYDGVRKVGIVAPITRLAIPGTYVLSLEDANKYPDVFHVMVVGDGIYNGNDHAIKVKFMLSATPVSTREDIAVRDKRILKKYLAYLLREGECSTSLLMSLSDEGKKKKAMLDAKYKEVMQQSVDKMNAYFNLL